MRETLVSIVNDINESSVSVEADAVRLVKNWYISHYSVALNFSNDIETIQQSMLDDTREGLSNRRLHAR